MHRKAISTVVLFFILTTGSVPAALLVYEGFDYPTQNDATSGRLAGRLGGRGFTGAWQDSTSGSNGGEAFIYDSQGNPVDLYDGLFGQGKPDWDGVVANLPSTGGYAGLSDWSSEGSGQDRLNSHRTLAQNADELAGPDGVLWASMVVHYPNSGFYGHPGLALTDGASFEERAKSLSASGNGVGIGNGNSSPSWPTTDLNTLFWTGGGEVAGTKTGISNISSSLDNIIILKFEFGDASDTVSAWYFTEGQTMTESSFNANAGSSTSSINETNLNTLAFSLIRKENCIDEIRIGDTFDDVISGLPPPREPLRIVDMVHDSRSNLTTLTWLSNPGDFYGLYWSEDLTDFFPGINPAVEAAANTNRTTYGPFSSPNPPSNRMFFRLGPADLADPELKNVWGAYGTIRLTFSEAMDAAAATDPSKYSVTMNGTTPVAVTNAILSLDGKIATLALGAPLASGAAIAVTMNDLADLGGRLLGNPTTVNFKTYDNDSDGVKVFILAGQSNMVGYGRAEEGVGGVIGAIGSLRYMVDTDPANYGHLVDGLGDWRQRDDVNIWCGIGAASTSVDVSRGHLDIGFASGASRIGPEYAFGWVLGDYYTNNPVLIIKVAWGGKSLFADFRPPSSVAASGGAVGPYYEAMIAYVRDVLYDLGSEFPDLNGKGYQIAGFGWHQGYNDRINGTFSAAYETNLVNLINDLRAEFSLPDMPVSIATTGMAISGNYSPVEQGQLNVANPALHPEYTGTVFTTDTRPFWRDASVSPTDQGYHWNHNGETYYLIGKGMGEGMTNMLSAP